MIIPAKRAETNVNTNTGQASNTEFAVTFVRSPLLSLALRLTTTKPGTVMTGMNLL